MPASGALDLLMVSGEYPPSIGGVGDYTEILCRALLRHGMKVGVLTTQRAAVHGHRDDGLHVLRTVGKWDRGCWGRVAGAARETGARIVHFQYQAAAYQLHGAVNLLPLFLRLRTPGVRTVTTFHDLKVPYLFPKAGRLRKASLRAMARYSDGLVLTNGADLAEMGDDQKGRRWCIPIGSNIPNSPPISYDRQEWRRTRFCAAPETLVLAYFGLANLSKGIEVAVQAASILRARGTDVRLVVVGGQEGASDPTNRAYAESLSRTCAEPENREIVVLTGHATPSEVSAHLLAADIAVLPFRDGVSLRRGSLLAVLEHGLPVVTTAPTSPEPLLDDGENVLLVREPSAGMFADSIESLWREPSRRHRLADGARGLAKKFDWDIIASQHAEMYACLSRGIGSR